MFYVWQHDTDSFGDKQVLCLRPTVPGVASLSSVIVSNILGIIFFGGAAQTGGVGNRAAVVPEPTGPILGTVSGPAPILVPVPGQEHVVIMVLYSDLNSLGAELHPITESHWVSKGWTGSVEPSHY